MGKKVVITGVVSVFRVGFSTGWLMFHEND